MSTTARRTARRTALAAAAGGVALAGLAATAPANAAPAHTDGFSAVESCTGLTGTLTHQPGLVKKHFRNDHAVLSGTLSGCSGFNGAQGGTGTITIVLDGRSKVKSVQESGTFVVNWPASSGLNPSTGRIALSRATAQDPYSVVGSVSTGAYTGASVSTSLLAVGHSGRGVKADPLVGEQVVNTAPLSVRVNLG